MCLEDVCPVFDIATLLDCLYVVGSIVYCSDQYVDLEQDVVYRVLFCCTRSDGKIICEDMEVYYALVCLCVAYGEVFKP